MFSCLLRNLKNNKTLSSITRGACKRRKDGGERCDLFQENALILLEILGIGGLVKSVTAQKIKFSIKDYFSKCDQIRRKLRIWSHLLKKSLMKNFIFCAVGWIFRIERT